MKNIIVVGGVGFIGGHLVERLRKTPGVERIRVYDRNARNGIDPDFPPVEFFREEIATGALTDLMRGCDTVFHLAANADIARAATEPSLDFWQGTHLTQIVLEAMRETGAKRLFYTSGSGVYGDRGAQRVHEDMPARPVSPYGAAKASSEAMICAYSAMFGICASIFRFANVVGPRQTHGVAYDFIRKLKADPTRLEILGNGLQSKSYIHVSDVLNAMMLVEEKQHDLCDTWNVATQDWINVSEIAALVVASMSLVFKQPDITYTGGPVGWKGDVPVTRFDCRKIEALGWKPEHNSGSAVFHSILAMVRE